MLDLTMEELKDLILEAAKLLPTTHLHVLLQDKGIIPETEMHPKVREKILAEAERLVELYVLEEEEAMFFLLEKINTERTKFWQPIIGEA